MCYVMFVIALSTIYDSLLTPLQIIFKKVKKIESNNKFGICFQIEGFFFLIERVKS